MFLLFLLLPSLDLVHPLCGCFPFWMDDTVVALLSCRTTVFLSCHGWILTNFGFKSFILSVPSCFCCAMARG